MGSIRLPNSNSNGIYSFYNHAVIYNKNFWIYYFSIFLLEKIIFYILRDFVPNFKFKWLAHSNKLNIFLVNKHITSFFLGAFNVFKYQKWYCVKIFYFKKIIFLTFIRKLNFFYLNNNKIHFKNYKNKYNF